jgi:hypothetical protein
MKGSPAAVTMVRDDLFFLRRWISHYGGLFGRENLYIVNHGHGAAVAAEAEGCNLVGIPQGDVSQFDKQRWRLLNGIVNGLLPYFTHVIVGDVDELVVLDPATGQDLAGWLAAQPRGSVLTPLCLELVHDRATETETIGPHILGPRRYARTLLKYCKPCVISTQTHLSRGGHFASEPRLSCPDPLYLFHLKYCDFATYSDTMTARNRVAAATGTQAAKSHVGRHWFAEFRGEDAAIFDSFARLPADDSFDFSALRQGMRNSFGPRGDSGFFQFDIRDRPNRHRIPDRFFGLI